jgi:DNA-binding NtrC family response regulator
VTAPPADPEAILVVEDEMPLHHILSRVCEMAGGEAFIAVSGAEARHLLDERSFAAALLDKNLPDANGIELLRLIKERQPRTEVLIVTGYANIESVTQALRLGAYDYVEKPFDLGVLTERLKAALAKRRILAADVAQNLEGSLDRLSGELEVIAGLLAGAASRLRAAPAPPDPALMRDLDQSVDGLNEAVDGAKQLVRALTEIRSR